MRHFLSVKDIGTIDDALLKAKEVKMNPFANQDLGKNKTALLIFFNSSLRTRFFERSKSGNQFGNERNGSGCESRSMEIGNRKRSCYGWRQAGAYA